MTPEEPERAKIYSIETGKQGHEKIKKEGSIPNEIFIERLDRCAKSAGLEKGLYSSDNEIRIFLEEVGFKPREVESFTTSLLGQLCLYLQDKYADYIFRGYGKENFLNTLRGRMEATQKIIQGRLSDEEKKERKSLREKSFEGKEGELTNEDHDRLLELDFLANSNLSINEIREMIKIGNKSAMLGGEDKLLPEEYTRLMDLRKRARESNPWKWLFDMAATGQATDRKKEDKALADRIVDLMNGGLTSKEGFELVDLESRGDKITANERNRLAELKGKYTEGVTEGAGTRLVNQAKVLESRYLEYKEKGLTGDEAFERAELEEKSDEVTDEGLADDERARLFELRKKTKE